jgi:cytochrome c
MILRKQATITILIKPYSDYNNQFKKTTMKKNICILALAVFCFSCGGGNTDKSGNGNSSAGDPDVDKGLALVGKSDCFGCHKINETFIGPAYNAIGKKYENNKANIDTLAEKIQKGGYGNWGSVPMAAHTGISKEDAVLMAKYVLSLKDEK